MEKDPNDIRSYLEDEDGEFVEVVEKLRRKLAHRHKETLHEGNESDSVLFKDAALAIYYLSSKIDEYKNINSQKVMLAVQKALYEVGV